MQLNIEFTAIILLLANFVASLQGFARLDFKERMLFEVDRILIDREFYRMVSSGFIHANWPHLILNMLSLYMFARPLDFAGMSVPAFLILYASALLGSSALALYLHRNHGDYRSLGASGAISGVIFAAISLFPSIDVWFIPGWLFGILYILATIYGIKAQKDNIGHEAHLGGAIVGILFAVVYAPGIMKSHPLIILAMLGPAIVFLYLIYRRPEMLLIPSSFSPNLERVRQTIGRSTTTSQASFQSPEEEIDHLLDKGIENLSSKERKRLEELSRSLDD